MKKLFLSSKHLFLSGTLIGLFSLSFSIGQSVFAQHEGHVRSSRWALGAT
jgi:hypothetical protein